MTVADEVGSSAVCARRGFRWQESTAGGGRRAEGARVSFRCQLGRDAAGDHVGDLAGGIFVNRFPFRALEAGQAFDSLGNEGSWEQDLHSCGKPIA